VFPAALCNSACQQNGRMDELPTQERVLVQAKVPASPLFLAVAHHLDDCFLLLAGVSFVPASPPSQQPGRIFHFPRASLTWH
jgi:hypothetical protein